MGFFEIMLIAIVALLVVGPEKLPETVRSVALWVGRIKRSLRDTRSEIERQIGADDIRRQLHNEEVMRNLNATREEMERVMDPERAERLINPERYNQTDELPDHAHGDSSPPPETQDNDNDGDKRS